MPDTSEQAGSRNPKIGAADLSTFASYGRSAGVAHHWGAALLGSCATYALVALLVVALTAATKKIIIEQRVDVTFVEKVVKELPPPAPPPQPVAVEPAKPAAAPAAAPIVRPEQKGRKLDKPPPPIELVAPKEMPKEAPKEAGPSEDKGVAVYGEPGRGDAAGLEGGMQRGVVGGQVGVIEMPPDAERPRLTKEIKPAYPEVARARGRTAVVLLKMAVMADGSVGEIKVARGDEPFVSSAIAAVKQWHFTPARVHGQPISTFIVVKVPFTLDDA